MFEATTLAQIESPPSISKGAANKVPILMSQDRLEMTED
jgi:hypothetical protein